ncbi:hypothetical protein [Paramagnetospirillum magnetotacticum]|uniref:hypothetical protein n=1 Tax=Paramagnetospirillum magnetotacticum TaxID=188 RepID=UPI00059702D9|nr:hypothetical protein [Paramagnetospirillum magnetotacticum]
MFDDPIPLTESHSIISPSKPLTKKPSTYVLPEPKAADLSKRPTDMILDGMRRIANDMDCNRHDRAVFDCLRGKYFALAMELNLRREIAPIYRPRMKVVHSKSPEWSEIDGHFAIDLQVLDLDWLGNQNFSSDRCSKNVQPIFADGFDLEKAADFATAEWGFDKKITALGLELDEVWDLAMLRPAKVRSALVEWRKEAKRFGQWLGRHRTPQIQNQAAEWEQLWLARKVAAMRYTGLTVADDIKVSPTDIAREFMKMTGQRLDPDTVSRRIVRLLKAKKDMPRKA